MRRPFTTAIVLFSTALLLPTEGTPVGVGTQPRPAAVQGAFITTAEGHWEGQGALAAFDVAPATLSVQGREWLRVPRAPGPAEGMGRLARATNRRAVGGWVRAPWFQGVRWAAVAPGVQLQVLAPERGAGPPRVELVLAAGAQLPAGHLRLGRGVALSSALAWRQGAGERPLVAPRVGVDPAGWVTIAPEPGGGAGARRVSLALVAPAHPVELAAR